MMGTPYPVIDTIPGIFDVMKAIRWYEHVISAPTALSYRYWILSKTSTRHARLMHVSRSAMTLVTFILMEFCFCYRSLYRLTGYLPNDYECRKYGVMEDKERLEHKKQMWEKYAKYKKEWCRRFDYHVYGIRDVFAESQFTYEIPKDETVPLVKERPEFKYLYRGPEKETLAKEKK